MSYFYTYIPYHSTDTKDQQVHLERHVNPSWEAYSSLQEDEQNVLLFSGFYHPEGNFNKGDLLSAFKNNAVHAPLKLRGSFSGVYWSKKDAQWLLFTDPLGTKPLYYAKTKDGWLISNHYDTIAIKLSEHIKLSLNSLSVYQILTYGYSLEKNTILKGIYRIPIGSVGVLDCIQNTKFVKPDIDLQTQSIYKLPVEYHTLQLEEAAEEVNRLFQQSIHRSFQLDLNMGREHLVALSGGLDSRMTSWVAHSLGYKNQTNLTFGQSNSLDKTIAQKISHDLEHQWNFLPLDGGDILLDMDMITQHTGGNVYYYGQAHTYRSLERIDVNRFGLLHTGMLGDVVLGSYLQKSHNPSQFPAYSGASSTRFFHKLTELGFSSQYPNEEHHKMMLRGLYGMNMGLLSVYNKTESYSPFTDLDFFDFCLQIPVNLRANHRLYLYWMKTYYPGSTKYIWEKTRAKVTAKNITIGHKSMPLNTWLWKVYEKIRFRSSTANPNFMTPIDYWLQTETKLRNELDHYAQELMPAITTENDLQNTLRQLYLEGNGVEKVQALTVLSAAKRYTI